MEQKDSQPPSHGLIRGLGLWSATAVVVGSMIGQSVFLVAGDVARQLRSPLECMALWVAGGIVVLCGAFCYPELGASMPEAGGDYVYQSRRVSRTWEFLYGWTSSLVLKPGSAAIIATGFSRLAAFLWPSAAAALIGLRMREPGLPRPYRVWGYPWTAWIFGIVALAISANLLWAQAVRSFVGLAIILLGFPFFHYWCRRSSDANASGGNPWFARATGIAKFRSSAWRAGR